MSIGPENVKNMAKMASIDFSEEELSVYTEKIDSILTLAKEMEQVDTANIEPTINTLSGGTPFRQDIAKPFANQAALLKGAPEISGTSFVVPRIL